MMFILIYIFSGILFGFLYLRILSYFKRSDLFLPNYAPFGKLKWNKDKKNLLYVNVDQVGNFEEKVVYQTNDGKQVFRGTVEPDGKIFNSAKDNVAFCSPNGKRWWGLKSALIAGILTILIGIIILIYNQIFKQDAEIQNTGLYIVSTGIIFLVIGIVRSYFTWWSEVYAVNTDGKVCDGKETKELIIGYANELRFSSTPPGQLNQYMKGGACLSLYKAFSKVYSEDEEAGVISSLSAKDLAFPAMLLSLFVFTIITFIFNVTNYNLIKHIGDFSYIITLFLVYGLIWSWLFNYKCENANYNPNLDAWIEVINRNTGLFSLNLLLILVSGILVVLPFFPNTQVGGFTFFPYYLVILFATIYNLKVDEGKRWKVLEPFEGLIKDNQSLNTNAGAQMVPVVVSLTTPLDEKKIDWDLSKLEINNKKLKKLNNSSSVQLVFQYYKSQIDETGGKVREENPFNGEKWKEAWEMEGDEPLKIIEDKFSEKVAMVLNEVSPIENEWLDVVVNQCKDIMKVNNLSDYEIFDLILNFCQTQINYVSDEDSTVKKAKEYVRFGVESIFDQKGDCDCKAALAYKLIKKLNLPSEDIKFAYIHPEKNTLVAFILIKEEGKFKFPVGSGITLISLNGKYVFCECTETGWKIGDHKRYDLSTLKILDI